jgi:deoxyribonuclease-4
MARDSEKKERDILKLLPPPKQPPKLTAQRIGIHTSTAGGVENAAERAYRLGCNAFQIFSSSPRQWKPYDLARSQCDEMNRLRAQYGLKPLVIHANYLVNLAGGNPEFHAKSISAFRGEVERALALCADFLVLHPGSFRGSSREEGLQRVALAIEQAVDGLDLAAGNLRILVENTAGSEFSLGGNFEQVAELLYLLSNFVPAGACIDTCHTHVAGYDIVSKTGFAETLDQLERTKREIEAFEGIVVVSMPIPDESGHVEMVTQGKVLHEILDEFYKNTQVMIGEAISVSELRAFLAAKERELQ